MEFRGAEVNYVEEDTKRSSRITRAKIRGGTAGWTWWMGLAARLRAVAKEDIGVRFGQADKLDDRPDRCSVQIPHLEFTQHTAEWSEIICYCHEFLGIVDRGDTNVLIRVTVFRDPPGSCGQGRHTDIYHPGIGCDEFSVWNVFVPLQLPAGAPETNFDGREGSRNKFTRPGDGNTIVFFDGMRKHRGTGNKTAVDRLLLHLVFVSGRLLRDIQGRKEVREQYNNSKNLDDPTTQVGYFLQSINAK
jgi:hypothetical protein